MASGEFECSSMAANGLSERSIPVILVAASMIKLTLEEEDVACAVDDIKKRNFSFEGDGRRKGEQEFRACTIMEELRHGLIRTKTRT